MAPAPPLAGTRPAARRRPPFAAACLPRSSQPQPSLAAAFARRRPAVAFARRSRWPSLAAVVAPPQPALPLAEPPPAASPTPPPVGTQVVVAVAVRRRRTEVGAVRRHRTR